MFEQACDQRDAIQMFLSSGISGAPVLDGHRRLIGVLSETDIIKKEAGKVDLFSHGHKTDILFRRCGCFEKSFLGKQQPQHRTTPCRSQKEAQNQAPFRHPDQSPFHLTSKFSKLFRTL